MTMLAGSRTVIPRMQCFCSDENEVGEDLRLIA